MIVLHYQKSKSYRKAEVRVKLYEKKPPITKKIIMGVRRLFFKKNKAKSNVIISSPLNAKIIPLEDVPDPVFSQKMMGDGFAFIPNNGKVLAPIDGTVTQVFPTKHAIGMETKEGVEILLHLGLDTVELNGEGFEITVKAGDKIHTNDSLGTFDLAYLKEKGKETTTVLVFTNFDEKISELKRYDSDEVNAGAQIGELVLK